MARGRKRPQGNKGKASEEKPPGSKNSKEERGNAQFCIRRQSLCVAGDGERAKSKKKLLQVKLNYAIAFR